MVSVGIRLENPKISFDCQAETSRNAVSGTFLMLSVLAGVALRGWLRHVHTLFWALAWVPYPLLSALPMALASWLLHWKVLCAEVFSNCFFCKYNECLQGISLPCFSDFSDAQAAFLVSLTRSSRLWILLLAAGAVMEVTQAHSQMSRVNLFKSKRLKIQRSVWLQKWPAKLFLRGLCLLNQYSDDSSKHLGRIAVISFNSRCSMCPGSFWFCWDFLQYDARGLDRLASEHWDIYIAADDVALRYQWWRLLQMWQKHHNWRQQDERDALHLAAAWRRANHACKGRAWYSRNF